MSDDVVRELAPVVYGTVGTAIRQQGVPPYCRDELESAAWVGAAEAIKRYDPERGVSLPLYAKRRITGAVQDEIRALSGHRRGRAVQKLQPLHYDGFVGDAWHPLSDDELAYVDTHDVVQSVLRKLPARQAEVLAAVYLRDERVKDVAARLGTSAGALSQVLITARRAARNILQESEAAA